MTLKLHHLRPAPGAKKAKTRKGRGEASKGKTAGHVLVTQFVQVSKVDNYLS
jgi:hypothetical protein